MSDACSVREIALQAHGARGLHPVQEQIGVLRCERRVVADSTKKLSGSCRLKPVSILEGPFTMKCVFSILKMKAGDAERGDIVVNRAGTTDRTGTACDAKQDVRGYVVAERDGQSQEFRQGNIDAGLRIFVLQRAVGVRQETVLGKEADGLVERQLALLDLMQDCQSQGQFED
jgi:hypothetical protein